MTRLIDKTSLHIRGSKSIVSFETTGGGKGSGWKYWDRFISIKGVHQYHIGNICGTCEFFFEKLKGVNNAFSPRETIDDLNNGLKSIYPKNLNEISKIVPNGKYRVLLLESQPRIVELGSQDDYFVNEQNKSWELMEGDIPHDPKVQYYRGIDQEISNGERLFEFFIPLIPTNDLKSDTLALYEKKLFSGDKPTAIALSVLDIKESERWPNDQMPEISTHWCLAHYILDGHHKINAASKLKRPLTILSFLAMENGTASKIGIEGLIEVL